LRGDEQLRSGDPAGQALVGALSIIQADSPLKINRAHSQRPARPPFDPLEGMPLATLLELADINEQMDRNAAIQMTTQRVAAVLPMVVLRLDPWASCSIRRRQGRWMPCESV